VRGLDRRHPSRAILLVAAALTAACTSRQQFASLGDLRLESGQVLRDSQLGYRTFGRLDPARRNAVLLTTWFQGTAADLAGHIGPGRLVDSSRYFVIAVDAFGNGVSSSPSNSRRQPAAAFPTVSIRDMVNAQHQLLTQHLGIDHLKAVVGISMGGMQAFQWATGHPGFVDKVVSIAGSPQSQDDDRRRWRTSVDEVRTRSVWSRAFSRLRTGAPRGAFEELRVEADDYAAQAEAISRVDVAAPFNGSLSLAAKAVRADLLFVYSPDDQVVNPQPGVAFARLVGGQVLELERGCGHDAPTCERQTLWPAVSAFLSR
jgi:homoserine O-acetyltransferase